MKRLLVIALPFLLTAVGYGQLPQIRITSVFPFGAQRGQTVDVSVATGTDLDEATDLVFNHPGLKAVPKKDGNGNPIANQFTVTVDESVTPGLYDVRLRGLFGISNPRIFRVDTLPEVPEKEPNNGAEQAQEVAVNTIVNARSNGAADVDLFRIAVQAGQTIVFRSEAASIDSLMQPVLELFDATGRRVAHSRRQRQKDAVVLFTSPADQTLQLKVHDTVYGGSNDYGYRLSIDTRPVIDFAVPQVVQAGVETQVTLFGRNIADGQPAGFQLDGLPVSKKEIKVNIASDSSVTGTDSVATSVDTAIYGGVDGNLLQFALSSEAMARSSESEDSAKPPLVSLPATVSGAFAKEMDEDAFRFEAKTGEQWQIDIFAQRLGSNAAPMLIVEQVTVADDGTETVKRLAREDEGKINPGGANLPTLTSDPAFTLNVPADGLYQVRLRDRFAASRGSADLTWTAAIRKQTPDFRVIVFDSLPSADGKAPPDTGAVSIRKGGTYQIPVYAYRTGGHNTDIELRVEGLPVGITCAPAKIAAKQNSSLLVFSAAENVGEVTASVRVIGTSTVGEQKLEHAAKVTTLVHAGVNGLPRTARVSGSMLVGVMKDEEPFHVIPAVTAADMTQDQQLLIPLKLVRRAGFDNKVDIAFAGQPGNVDVPKVSIEKGKDTFLARFYFKENAATGPATLMMYVTGQVPYRRNPWQVDRAKEKVAAAVAKLESTKKTLADAKAAADAGAKKVTELAAMLKTYEGQLAAENTAMAKVQADLKAAVAGKAEATKQLVALKEKLAAAAANKKPEEEDLDAAIKAVEEATAAVAEATKPITALTQQLKVLSTQIEEKKKLVDAKTKQIETGKAAMAEQQKAVEKAKADVTAAEAGLKAGEAEKKAADEAVKKAEAASKPQNKNYRAIAVPVQLNVHATPGKLAAAVPNSGQIKKGATADVKVTLTRKNKFAGPVKVALVLPDGVTSVSSNTVEIPADKTEAILTLTAAADAAPGDIAHAVIRATADFNGRQAGFDAPVALKVIE